MEKKVFDEKVNEILLNCSDERMEQIREKSVKLGISYHEVVEEQIKNNLLEWL